MTAEQSPVTEEARVESFDCMDGAQGASPVIEATKGVAGDAGGALYC